MRGLCLWVMMIAASSVAAFGAAPPPDLTLVNDETPLTVGLFSQVAEKSMPSVVSIRIHLKLSADERKEQQKYKDFLENPSDHMDDPDFQKFMQRYFGGQFNDFQDFFLDPENLTVASGAGVIFDSAGHIVTNDHVISRDESQGDIEVKLYDGRTFRGDKVKVVAEAPLVDLAVLKIEGLDLRPAEFGDSEKVRISEPVLAIGHPLELDNSVSEGIISAKGRQIDKAVIEDHFQTTAMINPGNSGGALVNMRGEVVGINIAIATTTRRWQGIGFAVPSNTVRKVVENIIRSGKEGFGYLGIQMLGDSIVGERARLLNWYGLQNGVIVEGTVAGAAADKGGVKPDDIIVEVDGREIEDNQDLIRTVASRPIGDPIKLKVLRPNGKQELEPLDLSLVLGERPSQAELDEQLGAPTEIKAEEPVSQPSRPLGIQVEPAPEGLKILSVDEDSAAQRGMPVALQPGDVILRINWVSVSRIADLADSVDASHVKKRAEHLVHFTREGKLMRTLVPLK